MHVLKVNPPGSIGVNDSAVSTQSLIVGKSWCGHRFVCKVNFKTVLSRKAGHH